MSATPQTTPNLDLQYRTLLILWSALLMSIVGYSILSVVLPQSNESSNRLLTIVLSAASFFLVVVSFVVKRKYLSRAVESQDINQVKAGVIVACALCEAGALMGLLDLLLAHDRYYLLLIGLGFIGLLLHFPKRRDLEAASSEPSDLFTK